MVPQIGWPTSTAAPIYAFSGTAAGKPPCLHAHLRHIGPSNTNTKYLNIDANTNIINIFH